MFLDAAQWTDKIFIGGSWAPGSAGTAEVTEPATGNPLGRIGVADAGDLATAAESAAEAQREWAATPHPRRAAVLRRAAQLWTEHAEEISWWNVREVGAVPGMAGFAVHVAEQECYEAAALPSRPYGELAPSEEPRLSLRDQFLASLGTGFACDRNGGVRCS